jgi:hypothetical protein
MAIESLLVSGHSVLEMYQTELTYMDIAIGFI